MLTTVLTCIKSTCDPSLNADLLVSPLELTCDLAGIPISSAVVSSAVQAATNTAVITKYVTDTVTESYYWQSTFGTIATTVIVPVTGSDGRTLIVAFPVTIEPSTTIYGSPSTSTPDAQATSSPNSGYNFGSCSNPGIVYAYGMDGESQYSFEPANPSEFPHGTSSDIAGVESYICERLKDVCHATAEAQKACNEAFNAYSGLAGQNAADVWNIALGLSETDRPFTTTTLTVTSTMSSMSGLISYPTSVTPTTTTDQAPDSGNSITMTATITSVVVAGSSGNPNADGGGSPFSAASRERASVFSFGMVLILVMFTILH